MGNWISFSIMRDGGKENAKEKCEYIIRRQRYYRM